MRFLSLLSMILIGICGAQESIAEDPPLYFIDDIPDDPLPPIIAEEEKPLVFPDEMPVAAQIIVEASEDLSDLDYTGINWTEFYADFQHLELNLTKNITMLNA